MRENIFERKKSAIRRRRADGRAEKSAGSGLYARRRKEERETDGRTEKSVGGGSRKKNFLKQGPTGGPRSRLAAGHARKRKKKRGPTGGLRSRLAAGHSKHRCGLPSVAKQFSPGQSRVRSSAHFAARTLQQKYYCRRICLSCIIFLSSNEWRLAAVLVVVAVAVVAPDARKTPRQLTRSWKRQFLPPNVDATQPWTRVHRHLT